MPPRKTTGQFIKDARKVHGEKYDYSKVNYQNSSKKVLIICNNCNLEFLQLPCSHLSGCGCPPCAKEKVASSQRKTKDMFVEEAKKVHGDRYDYSKVDYKSVHDSVTITCKVCSLEFTQFAGNHLKGHGCSKCGHKKTADAQRKTIEQFVIDAKEVHGDKYDYSEVNYESTHSHVAIICKQCHEKFMQQPCNHLEGNGCPSCATKAKADQRRKTTEQFIKEAKTLHGDKYDYKMSEYTNARSPVTIICNECDAQFIQSPHHHLSGHGCWTCGIKRTGDALRKTTEQFIKDAKEAHGDKYDYSKVDYVSAHRMVTIICNQCKLEFYQIANNHLSGYGCSNCSFRSHSKMSIEWLDFIKQLEDVKIRHAENGGEFTIPDTRYRVDGFCDETKEVFEFYGDYFHGNPEKYKRDTINSLTGHSMGELYDNTIRRQKRIEALGYKVTFIWESEWKKISEVMKSYLGENGKGRKRKFVE